MKHWWELSIGGGGKGKWGNEIVVDGIDGRWETGDEAGADGRCERSGPYCTRFQRLLKGPSRDSPGATPLVAARGRSQGPSHHPAKDKRITRGNKTTGR